MPPPLSRGDAHVLIHCTASPTCHQVRVRSFGVGVGQPDALPGSERLSEALRSSQKQVGDPWRVRVALRQMQLLASHTPEFFLGGLGIATGDLGLSCSPSGP